MFLPANAPAAPPAAMIPSHTHFLCDLWLPVATTAPPVFEVSFVKRMVFIGAGRGAAATATTGLAGVVCRLASMARGVMVLAGRAASGAAFGGAAAGGAGLGGTTFAAGVPAVGG